MVRLWKILRQYQSNQASLLKSQITFDSVIKNKTTIKANSKNSFYIFSKKPLITSWCKVVCKYSNIIWLERKIDHTKYENRCAFNYIIIAPDTSGEYIVEIYAIDKDDFHDSYKVEVSVISETTDNYIIQPELFNDAVIIPEDSIRCEIKHDSGRALYYKFEQLIEQRISDAWFLVNNSIYTYNNSNLKSDLQFMTSPSEEGTYRILYNFIDGHGNTTQKTVYFQVRSNNQAKMFIKECDRLFDIERNKNSIPDSDYEKVIQMFNSIPIKFQSAKIIYFYAVMNERLAERYRKDGKDERAIQFYIQEAQYGYIYNMIYDTSQKIYTYPMNIIKEHYKSHEAELYYRIGEMAQQHELHTDALLNYLKAIGLNYTSNDVTVNLKLAKIAEEHDLSEIAKHYYKQISNVMSDDGEVNFKLGVNAEKSGDKELAKQYYKQSMKQNHKKGKANYESLCRYGEGIYVD